MSRKLNCNILTPEKTIYDGDIDFVVVQAHDGELGFLPGHAPLISELGIGEIRLRDKTSTEYLIVEGGIVEIRENKLIILAENAMMKDELNKEELDKLYKELDDKQSEMESFSEERIEVKLQQEKIKARLKVALR